MDIDDALDILSRDPARTGLFTDLDGTLSEIVDDPDAAVPIDGAAEVLGALAELYRVVGVISGRSLEQIRDRLVPPGVVLAGAYGRERSDRRGVRRRTEGWEAVAVAAAAGVEGMDGVTVETKGSGTAIHYRGAPQREDEVIEIARELADTFELEIRPGRLVAELTVPGPGKGDALAELAGEHDLDVVFYGGDDVADAEAFERARTLDATSVLVAVSSEESPPELTELADLVLGGGPRSYLAFLESLRDRVSS